jgi:hypothetical protein
MKLLNKISWMTRRWNYRFQLFNVYLHDENGSWGIDVATFIIDHRASSLFSIMMRLPNFTTIRRLTIDEFDIFYLRRPLYNQYDDLSDAKLWGAKLTKFQTFRLNILEKLFKI